jgi:cell division protein FtsI/penicillin-binding protein 2
MMVNWRVNLTLFLFILFAMVIVFKLVELQIINGGFYKAQALGQQRYTAQIKPERGEIYFNDEETPLAVNKINYSLYISPEEITEKEKTIEILTKEIGVSKDFLLNQFSKKGWVLIKKDLEKKEIVDLEGAKLKGVYLIKELKRYYPQEELASRIVGFVGGENVGQYGLEGYYDKILKGEEGIEQLERGRKGILFFLTPKTLKSSLPGADIVLTLDYNIQLMSEKILKQGMEATKSEEGEIIVIDPYTGEILAFSVFPSFNPNQYFKTNLELFQNPAVQKLFEPGSIFKPFTMMAGLNEKKVRPDTLYEDFGYVKVGSYIVKNYHNRVWGKRTMEEVIEHSINTGAIFVKNQIGNEVFWDYFEKFGFNEPTGIDLQGEVYSKNLTLKKGGEIHYTTASFGQGIEITSIQLVRAFCALINGGKLIKPHLVKKIKQGENTLEIKPTVFSEIRISDEARNDLIKMLIGVIERGTGELAKIPGYYIGGKTGTAQLPYTALGINKPGYSDDSIQSFIGFLPAFDPKFLVFVKFYRPATREAAVSAVPVFKKMVEYLIDYFQIPPDYETNNK